jgi:DHA1 family multidrug resistance protein-like MFS transporter
MCAAGMASFPQEAAYPVLSLGLWAAGITLLGTSPTALVTDIAGLRSRSQAIALFRTVGDVGLLLGAATGGYMADHTSIATAMQADAALLLATSTVFGLNAFRHRRRA